MKLLLRQFKALPLAIAHVFGPYVIVALGQTSGGVGGSGGSAGVNIGGNNYGTIVVQGGSGGTGGSATSSQGGGSSPSQGGSVLAPGERSARLINFVVTNRAAYAVNVKFFSDKHIWPPGDSSYLLKSRSPTPFRLPCESGEKICFGAFYNSGDKSWGAGRYGDKSCNNCCMMCSPAREVVFDFALND
jgi:hypothetical protein